MMDNYDNDLIDRKEIGKYFPEIFETFSNTGEGKHSFIMNVKSNFAYLSGDSVDFFGLSGNRINNPLEQWASNIDPHDQKKFFENIQYLFSGELSEHNQTYRIKNGKGEYVTCTCNGKMIYDENGEQLYFAGTIINHQKNAVIDPVTGLHNREGLLAFMKHLHAENKKYYFLMMGLKQFYKVNYSYGYEFGNHILNKIADLWRNLTNEEIVFRTEGTKMVIVFDQERYTEEDITKKFQIILEKLKEGIEHNGCTVFLSTYACLYQSNNFSLDVNTIYNCALYAANKAKQKENDELFFVTEALFSGNNLFIEKLNHIRSSIPNNFKGFYLVYQPIVSAKNSELMAAEALLRWKDDTYGLVPPNEFIEWLEGDSIFYDLGNWIIRQAVRDMKELVKAYPDLLININLAYPQLQNSNFNTDLCNILEEEGFNPKNLNLELTERCKFSNKDHLRSSIAFFKSMGIKSALDDFGTGYSALDLMVELQVDEIKIDKSFIQNIDEDISRQSLLKAVTGCADELGKRICIEGVETNIMAEYMYNHFKVTKFQGYYFSKPLEKKEFISWAKSNKKAFYK